ncbi:MAG: DoxX family protein [Nocardioidaceae bacterium]
MIAVLRAQWFWIQLLARLVVGGVWIAAGLLKLGSPDESVRAVRAYQILPESVVPAVGYALPAFEIVVGVLLIVGLGLRLVSILSGLLLVAFVIGISSVWARGIEIECGCFGGGGANANATGTYPWEIARDVGLLILSVAVAVWPRGKASLDHVFLPSVISENRGVDAHG